MKKGGKIAVIVSVCLVLLLVAFIVIAKPNPRATKACKDGIDNDGDGYIDWPNDPGCIRKNDRSELGKVECDDGIDNDGDGKIDYNDGGCSSPADNDETNCGDGVCEGGETSENCLADCGYPDSCSDTDGGWNPTVQGTVSGYKDGQQYSYDDYCADDITVMEYYCSGGNAYNWREFCGNMTTHCVNGACV